MKNIIFTIICLLISVQALAHDVIIGKVIDIYDADTFTVEFDLGFNLKLTEKVRVMNYDSPELRTKDLEEKKRGYEARDYTSDLILGKTFEMIVYKRDKYGRPLIDLILPDGEILSTHLVESGRGVFYDGGTKAKWKFD